MIQLERVSKRFRSGRGTVQALSDVSLFLDSGKTMAVAGKSGSGKTTLLNIVGGLERPDEGKVTCFGIRMAALSEREVSLFLRRKVGFVFQYGNLLSYLSVFENIAFPLKLNGMERKERKRRVVELLEQIDLSDAARALPFELSGGEVQRVSIARALAHSPRMLLADEPTASLDSATGCRLIELLFEIGKHQGCTTLVCTHDPEIIRLADTSIQLKDGMVVTG
jgi:ABC-type lipoprotein export system ATPase subunit